MTALHLQRLPQGRVPYRRALKFGNHPRHFCVQVNARIVLNGNTNAEGLEGFGDRLAVEKSPLGMARVVKLWFWLG